MTNIKASNGFISYAEDAVKVFGIMIREKRIAKKMSQVELAERIGSSRKTVSAIENGSPKTNIGTVFLAAAILKINLFDADERLMKNTMMNKNQIKALLPKSVRKSIVAEKVNDDF
ncbi:MAG: helix-turn-helix transcriptional regulator [Pseudomonadales bacterium]|nr:helix-turn-helix transcriptional regulator [Pseudomonadales bacterium]